MVNKIGLTNLARHIFKDCEPCNCEEGVLVVDDTSATITDDELNEFLKEVQSITSKAVPFGDGRHLVSVDMFTAMWKHEWAHEKARKAASWNMAKDYEAIMERREKNRRHF